MYLKRLQIQGYKSFANNTEFVFNGGITAIVGPNGSGKSNIADAIRWALGEQSYSVLRAKRTEDLIFSGSAQRARLGLAEVSLTLDNTTQWLPVDYGEVTITRRAYRSGENEYYLNGGRVRLRDIAELLTRAGLGRNASAVIGQGQVDTALTLRPEDRRSLLEEAAGVRLYIDRRDESLVRLEETARNLERVNDIVSEIAPRLETLRRQAERAREHEAVRHELESTLLQWYGYQWQRNQDRLARAEENLAGQSELVSQKRTSLELCEAQREELRNRQLAARAAIAHHRQAGEQLRSRYEDMRRRVAVAQERSHALERQQEQVSADLAAVEARRADLAATLEREQAELAALVAGVQEQEAAAIAARAEVAAAEANLRAQRDELERARAAAFEAATAQAAAHNRQAQLERRRADLEREQADEQAALSASQQRADAASSELEVAERERQRAVDDLARVEQELRQAEDGLAATLTRLDQRRAERDAARESHQRLRSQHDVLQRARSQGSYLHDGVQAIIQAGMPGVLGTIASLVRVPPDLEVAMEAALGAHLQDIVVKTWNDALACIEHLKRGDRGRATFLPLDYVRPGQPIPAPRVHGVRGIAARLVKADGEFGPVCELLLGNIVIVDDLPAGRRALAAESRLRRAVTLEGDVVEARGVVRGGSRPRSRGQLAQEREWRDLPAQLAAAETAARAAEALVQAEDEAQQAYRQQARECAQRLQTCRAALSQQEQRTNSLRQRHDRLQQEVAWHRTLEEQARRSLAGLQADQAQVEGELAALAKSLAAAQERVEGLRVLVERDDLQDLRRRAAQCETAHAVSLRSRQAQEQLIATRREGLARADAEAQALARRLGQAHDEATALEQELATLGHELQAMQQAQEALAGPLAEAEADLQAVEKEQAALEADEERIRQELQAALVRSKEAMLERDRVLEESEEVKRQMEVELGPVEVPDVGQPRQLRLNLGDGVTPLPRVTELPAQLTSRLNELRSRLRRLGPVNLEAPTEYEEVLQRYQFLTDQVQDLTTAAQAAREIIAELNQLIRERLSETFRQVAREFRSCFSTLFNGGTARLLLTEPDNPAESGLEIIAQPPGKRSQSLALLSGGERALTAVALLFSLLKVSPLPFCVLDEVDAMLDESNVHRFRTFVDNLSQRTQFIVITHNRATVEAASTVYGISMGRDGISQVLSLALPDEANDEAAGAPPAA